MQLTEPFQLPVTYKGKEVLFDAEFSSRGYIHRITVDVNGTFVFFEPDEERNYRAVLVDITQKSSPDPELIRAIMQSLEDNFRD